MFSIFSILATPIGWLMKTVFEIVNNYFLTILLVTLIVRICTFPFNLKTQKNTADRARLAPRLERIQKKYAKDRQKMALKQQELYQKEGVSMTGGCLPSILQMLVLFSMLAVIYNPIQYLTNVPTNVIDSAVSAVTQENYPEDTSGNKLAAGKLKGYYKELNLLQVAEKNKGDIIDKMVTEAKITPVEAGKHYQTMLSVRDEFSIGNLSLLENPWSKGFGLLWLIPLLSGLSAFAMSWLSMHYMKGSMGDQQAPGAGCSNGLMMYVMPIFSLVITFSVPGGVGLYWIFSNIIGLGQTALLNKIYNPAKIRQQAEIEYQERRRQRAEDKKRLAEQRAREQAELDRARQAAGDNKKKPSTKKKPIQQEQPEETALPEQIEQPESVEESTEAQEVETAEET